MIPEAVMRELRYIEVSTARKMRAPRAGPFTSRQRGQGFDFDELQPYRPGDDVRRIDWNVTARLDAPFVRHTHAERELNMMIAIDISRSMDLGTSHYSKREAMMFVTASLLFSALASQINTGLLAFSDRVAVASPPRRTRAAAWAVLEACWAAPRGSGRTALVPMVRQLARSLKRMSIVFLVSDFLSDEDLFGGPDLRVLAARHDVIAVVPEDPMEAELPAGPGYLRVSDLESGRRATVSLGARSRARFAAEARRRREALAAAFYRVPMEHVFVPADRSPVEPLLSLFARSVRR
ncbi:MAG TPA: DUF58 domain-containing protein [Vicinamibacterales bacterium]